MQLLFGQVEETLSYNIMPWKDEKFICKIIKKNEVQLYFWK